MVAAIEQGIAWQIRANREGRGWTQRELAERLETGQSAVSRLEDPEYGAQSLETLVRVAKAFDCALIVKLAPYSALAADSEDLSHEHLFARSYDDEARHVQQ